MSLETFTAPTRDDTLGLLLISNNDGTGFTLSDAGVYTLRASLPWYHSTSDLQPIGSMTAVDAGEEVQITVTDTPVTWYTKTEHVGDLVPLTFKFTVAVASTGPTMSILSLNADSTRVNTIQNEASLALPVKNGESWRIEGVLRFKSDAGGPTVRWGFGQLGTGAVRGALIHLAESGLTPAKMFIGNLDTVDSSAASNTNGSMVTFSGVLTAQEDDTLQFAWGDPNSTGNTISLMKGSHIVATKIAG